MSTNLTENLMLEFILAKDVSAYQRGPWVGQNMGTKQDEYNMAGQRELGKLPSYKQFKPPQKHNSLWASEYVFPHVLCF